MNNGKAISVLYLDDEEDMLDICKQYLERSPDMVVRTETLVKNAEDILASERFDVIISDYQMPEMNGIDFLKRIRSGGNDISFILFTGKGREEVVIEALNAGADSYIQKGGDARAQFTELSHKIRKLVAKRQAERSLRESEESYRSLFEGIQEGMAYCEMIYDACGRPVDWRYLKVNAQFTALTGLRDIEGKAVSEAIPGILEKDPDLLQTYNRVATTGRPEKIETFVNSIKQWLDISVISPAPGYFSAIFEDVSERKLAERERDTTIEFLRLVNCSKNVEELARSALTFFQRQSGCEAVGIRLKDGFDFPYWEARGFPQEFVLHETHLCSYDDNGKVCRDIVGNVILDCMCGNVICGRFDTGKDFFTSNGSFWTNSTTDLLATTSDSDRQARTRNRCNGEGYESVALIPLYLGKERYGLIQMNDRRKGAYSPQLIAQWERLAEYLSVALSKFMTDEALRESREKYRSLFETINESAAFFVYVRDGEGKIVDYVCQDINPIGLEALGFDSSEKLLGRRISSLGLNDTILPDMESVEEMNLTGAMVLKEKHLETGDRDIINAIIPIDGDHFILTSRDETAIKAMQRAADKEAIHLRAIMDVLPFGLIITDHNGRILEFNELAKEQWGGSIPSADSVDDYDKFKAWWHDSGIELQPTEWGVAMALRTGEPVLGQVLTIQGFDGVRRSIVNNAAPIRTNDGRMTGAVAASQDITKSMIQEEALRVANGKLKLLDTINRHDIRNRLMILRGNLQIAQRTITDPDCLKRLDVVAKAAETIEKHIDFAKEYQELGRTSPIWHSLKTEITTTFENTELADIQLKGEACRAEILADPMLRKVFQNLLENSVRYGDKPGRISVHCEPDANDLLVIYEDRGPGIPVGEKERIFEKGYGKGSGMGLFLIREILGITGIGIKENGVPGQGARFEIRVPRGRYRMTC